MQQIGIRISETTQRQMLLLAASALAGAAVQGCMFGGWSSAAWQLSVTALLMAAAYRAGQGRMADHALTGNKQAAYAPDEEREQLEGHEKQEGQEGQEREKLSMAGMLAAGIAHEIRNPLTSLRGFLQLSAPQTNPAYTAIMLSEVDRINEIVTELLELAKPKEMAYEPRDLTGLLVQTVVLLEAQANLNNVSLTVRAEAADRAPVIVACEENKLKQLFINLIKNAIEAAAGGGAIRIAVRAADDQAVVEVADNGQGLEQEQLERLGQPFYTTKEQGSGLGLMICRRIVQDHGGSIAFRSEAGRGTVVTVRLPLEPSRMEVMKARPTG